MSSRKLPSLNSIKRRQADEMWKHFEKGSKLTHNNWTRNMKRWKKERNDYPAMVNAYKNITRNTIARGTGSRGVHALRKKMARRSGSATRGGRRRSTRRRTTRKSGRKASRR
jgi:hypothetical protein